MSVTRELLRIVGGKKERVNIGVLAQNVKEDENHRFVTDEEKESWNEKLSKDGDVAESTVSILEETLEAFPKPKAGDKQKTLWGKIVKWQQDCLTKFGNYVLMSMLTNQHLNSTNNIPTSALVYLMQQAIQQNQSDINVLNTKAPIELVVDPIVSASYSKVYQCGEHLGFYILDYHLKDMKPWTTCYLGYHSYLKVPENITLNVITNTGGVVEIAIRTDGYTALNTMEQSGNFNIKATVTVYIN